FSDPTCASGPRMEGGLPSGIARSWPPERLRTRAVRVRSSECRRRLSAMRCSFSGKTQQAAKGCPLRAGPVLARDRLGAQMVEHAVGERFGIGLEGLQMKIGIERRLIGRGNAGEVL